MYNFPRRHVWCSRVSFLLKVPSRTVTLENLLWHYIIINEHFNTFSPPDIGTLVHKCLYWQAISYGWGLLQILWIIMYIALMSKFENTSGYHYQLAGMMFEVDLVWGMFPLSAHLISTTATIFILLPRKWGFQFIAVLWDACACKTLPAVLLWIPAIKI